MELDLFVSVDMFITKPPGDDGPGAVGGVSCSLDHLALGAHSQKSLFGDTSVDNGKLGCEGRSLFHLETTKTQSSCGEVEEPRGGKLWVGRGDGLPTTTVGLA